MSRPVPPRAARRSAPTYLHLYHGSKPERQKIGSPIQRLSHTRLHGSQIEQSFIYIKEQQFGSLHKAFVPSLVEFMRFLPTAALGVQAATGNLKRITLELGATLNQESEIGQLKSAAKSSAAFCTSNGLAVGFCPYGRRSHQPGGDDHGKLH
jgi:hypothetical protein